MMSYIRLNPSRAAHALAVGVLPPPPGCVARTLSELRALEPVSREPLIYLVPNFLSEEECDYFARLGHHRSSPSSGGLIHALGSSEWAAREATDPMAAALEERAGRLVGCAPHAEDGGFKLAYTHHEPEHSVRAPEGVHLDTNKRPHRHVTVLVYLNDVAKGGETVFPLAGASASLRSAAEQLAENGIHHTFDSAPDKRLGAALKLVNAQAERAAKGECGLKVKPQRGAACVFYTMGPSGAVDPNSFHFGSSIVAPCAGKWTLQFFKELPVEFRSQAGRAKYARQCHPLAASS
jgi:prolyl 4-hydroxylase